jgi:hypothetical protein
MKQAIEVLALAAGIAVVALLAGVLVWLSWDGRSGCTVPSPDEQRPATHKVLREV